MTSDRAWRDSTQARPRGSASAGAPRGPTRPRDLRSREGESPFSRRRVSILATASLRSGTPCLGFGHARCVPGGCVVETRRRGNGDSPSWKRRLAVRGRRGGEPARSGRRRRAPSPRAAPRPRPTRPAGSAPGRYTPPSWRTTSRCISVSVRPGNTEVTRTPWPSSSARSASAKARSANLLAAYDPHPGLGRPPGAGVDQDHPTAGGAQRGQHQPGQLGDRHDVHLELLPPGVGGGVGDGAEQPDPGGVHQHVEPGDARDGLGHRPRVGEVHRPRPRAGQLVGELLQRRRRCDRRGGGRGRGRGRAPPRRRSRRKRP